MKLGKKKETNYFDILNQMVNCSYRAAVQLDEMMHNFTNVAKKAEDVHAIEHEADLLLHGLIKQLNSAFITPIDREDLLSVGNSIDSITDSIEDVANSFDMLSIKVVQEPALEMAALAKSTCLALVEAVKEFEVFRNSKKLNAHVIEVNRLEEKGDALYRSTVKALYNSDMPVLEIIKWKEIYDYMEKIFDLCEDVADMLEATAMKNR